MKYLYSIMIFLCLAVNVAEAQNRDRGVTLRGTVIDAADRSPLVGVNIYLPDLRVGTVTDIDGAYILDNLPRVSTPIQVSYLGHQTIIETVNLQETQQKDFVMQEANASLNEVVVTGLTGNALLKDSPTPVSLVTDRDLRMTSSTNIIDAISKQPGMAQITTGGGISKPVIRGLGYMRVVVIDDGVRQEGQQWGDEHGIEVDAESVSQVEILKGPASLTYGSDAMAGVIIFHDASLLPKGTMKANVSTEYQTNNGLFNYSLNFQGNKGGLVWNTRWSQKTAHDYKNKYDGYVYNSRYKEEAASALLGISRSWGYSHLTLSYYHLLPGIVEGERSELTGGFTMLGLQDGEPVETEVPSSQHHSYRHGLPYQQVGHYKAVWDNSLLVGGGSLKLTLAYQQNRRQEFEEIGEDDAGVDFLLHTLNYNVRYLLPENRSWKAAVGLNGMAQRSINKGEEFLIPAYSLADGGLYGTMSRDFARWNISGGLRYDVRHVHSHALEEDGGARFTDFTRNFHALTGSVGATYHLSDAANLRLNLARGYRSPSVSEMGANGEHEGTFRYEIGNKDLKAEYSWQADLGFDYSSAFVSAQVTLFANRIQHYTYMEKLTDADGGEVIIDGVPAYQNRQGDARQLGGELTVDIHPVERLHYENAFSYVNSVQLHQPREGKYLPNTPAPRWLSTLRYDLIRDGKRLNNTYVSIELDYNLRQNHYYAVGNTETATPAYALLNFAAGTDVQYRGKRVASLFFTVSNLTDKAYQNHLSRLKYAPQNPVTGRAGVFNMGRSFGLKLQVPLEL